MMRLSRHAKNKLRWIQRDVPDVNETSLVAALEHGDVLGEDRRGNVRIAVEVSGNRLTVAVDPGRRTRDHGVARLKGEPVALYTYDGETDVLYVLLVDELEATINRTEELSERVHVDLDSDGQVVGVEVLYARGEGIDLEPVSERFGITVEVPFGSAA